MNDDTLRENLKLIFTEDKGPSPSFLDGKLDAAMESVYQYSLTKQLEARIDELENRLRVQFIPSHWERLRNETNSWAKYVDRRISELKHQLQKETNQ